jgi:hypothetical protein
MAMTAGTVTVNPDATFSGSGFALSEFNTLVAETAAKLSDAGMSMPTAPEQLAPIYRGLAQVANSSARLITYIKANAVTSIDSESIL